MPLYISELIDCWLQLIDKTTLNRTYALVEKVFIKIFEKLAISYCVCKNWVNFKQYMTECDKAQLSGKYYRYWTYGGFLGGRAANTACGGFGGW